MGKKGSSKKKGAIQFGKLVRLPVDRIIPNPDQPREHFDQGKLNELKTSMCAMGEPFAPIHVTYLPPDGVYMIIDGERRWRAAKAAGMKFIPAIVKIIPYDKVFEVSFAINFQREEMTEIEKANGIEKMITAGKTEQEIADITGMSRGWVTNMRKLKHLAPVIRNLLAKRKISGALALELAAYDATKQSVLLRHIRNAQLRKENKSLSVQELHLLVVRTAENLDLERRQRQKKGKVAMTASTLTVKDLLRNLERSNKQLVEFLRFGRDRMGDITGVPLENLQKTLRELELRIPVALKKIDEYL